MTIDHEMNSAEGWDVFVAIGTADVGTLRIERIDELKMFKSDYEAWTFVALHCIQGSERHTAALIEVFKDNPTERTNILDFLMTLGVVLPDIVLQAGEI